MNVLPFESLNEAEIALREMCDRPTGPDDFRTLLLYQAARERHSADLLRRLARRARNPEIPLDAAALCDDAAASWERKADEVGEQP